MPPRRRSTRGRAPRAAATSPARSRCRGSGRLPTTAGFRSRGELEAIYQGEKGLSPSDDVIAYCRIGERSSYTWFVLRHLLGFEKVSNYDGSWTEWGQRRAGADRQGRRPGST